MEEFRVPTALNEAELQFVDGRVVRGTLFVHASASVHSGYLRLEEWVEEAAMFFPFRPKGTEEAELVSKRSVLRLSVPAAPGDENMPTAGERCRVVIECQGSRFEGDIQLDMPDHQRRVLDYINQPRTFVSLHDGETVHLIQKRLIIRIIQMAG